MQYPGRIVRLGEQDDTVLDAVIDALNATFPKDERLSSAGIFDRDTENAVRHFQARHADMHGNPLVQDGEIGPLTWSVLFGPNAVVKEGRPRIDTCEKVIAVAEAQLGAKVREQPKDSNRGPMVDQYLASVGASPGNAWCCAFLYWCFREAAGTSETPLMIRTAGCLRHWREARAEGVKTIGQAAALEDPSLVQRGAIFIMDHGGGRGHTGIILESGSGFIASIEGNTDASKSREGGGVYRTSRKLNEINVGFIDYFGS